MVLIVGMARSGVAAARLLHSRGLSVFATDSGEAPLRSELDSVGIPYETGGHSPARFLEAEEIVMSPGVPLDIPQLEAARRKGIPILSEIEIASRYLKGDIVAITGSNGKTTTTTLIGEVLKATGRPIQVGGNIGRAMSSLVDSSTPDTINVIEVSSFQLDGIQNFRPGVAVLMNITPDHLDRYADFQAYRASKFRLFANQQASDFAVLNRDDPEVYPVSHQDHQKMAGKARRRLFSQRQPVEEGAWRASGTLYLDGKPVMPVADVPLRGSHNIDNVLATMAVAGCYGVSADAMSAAIRSFPGVEHRIEFVSEVNGVRFFNDSKATNVDSAIKAVESFEGRIIIILGGLDKGAPYAPLVEAMHSRVKHVVLIGSAAGQIAEAIAGRLPVSRAASMADAVRRGFELGEPGDVVLLSPACASFDMFANFEHRGKVFKEAVLAWPRN